MPSSALDGGREFADDRAELARILSKHRGKAQAITSRELARRLLLSTREVREIIAELVQEGQLIGASVDGSAGGYYIVETSEELEETRAILRARATEIFARDRALCNAWTRVHGRPLQPLLPTMDANCERSSP